PGSFRRLLLDSRSAYNVAFWEKSRPIFDVSHKGIAVVRGLPVVSSPIKAFWSGRRECFFQSALERPQLFLVKVRYRRIGKAALSPAYDMIAVQIFRNRGRLACGPHEKIDRVAIASIDKGRNHTAAGVIEPSADERETLLIEVDYRWSEVEFA